MRLPRSSLSDSTINPVARYFLNIFELHFSFLSIVEVFSQGFSRACGFAILISLGNLVCAPRSMFVYHN